MCSMVCTVCQKVCMGINKWNCEDVSYLKPRTVDGMKGKCRHPAEPLCTAEPIICNVSAALALLGHRQTITPL